MHGYTRSHVVARLFVTDAAWLCGGPPSHRASPILLPSFMSIVRAVSLKIASTFLFALMGAQGRYLGSTLPVGEIVFGRGLFALIPIVLVFGLRGELRGALQTTRLPAHLLRGSFSVVSTFCTFAALARLPSPTLPPSPSLRR